MIRPLAKNDCRNLLPLVPPRDCPEFALQRVLPEDKLKLGLRTVARRISSLSISEFYFGKRSKITLSIILFTGLLGCTKENQQRDGLPVDKGLRDFLNVHSLNASYEMPAGHTAYQVAVLEFEDGKLSRRGASSLGKMDESGNRTLNVQWLWGTHEGKFKTTLVMPGMSGKSESEFWRKLDGGWGTSETKSRHDEHAGFVILGFAQSALDNKGETNTPIYGEFRQALAEKKYLGALAVKTFKTFEEAKKESK